MRDGTVINFKNNRNLFRTLLLEYLHVFDRLFFFGAFGKYCDVRVVDSLPKAIGRTEIHKIPHVTELDRPFEIGIRILDRSREFGGFPRQKRLDENPGTLLHEAIHAMFGLYVCRGHDPCQLNYMNEIGLRGHKVRWEEAAEVIEKATADLNMVRSQSRLDMGIQDDIKLHENED